MPTLKLTKTNLSKLRPPETGYALYWDTECKGFGVRISAGGAARYVVETRLKGRKIRVTLCRADVMAPEPARAMARAQLAEIAKGHDPREERAKRNLEVATLDDALKSYLASRDLKSSTVTDMRRAMNEAYPTWLKSPIVKITREMVKDAYLKRVKVSKARANLSFRYLRAVLNYAAATYTDSDGQPLMASNPVRVLSEAKLWRKIERRRTVLHPEDLEAWLSAVIGLGDCPERAPGEGWTKPKLRNGDVYRDLFLFLALTGCRKSEALNLRKGDIDFNRRLLLFRDTKNRSDHELPLTDYLSTLLSRRRDETPGEYVFASRHDGRRISNIRYATARITDVTGLRFTPHDLRRLAASTLERIGVPTYTIKAILNHATHTSDVTGGYVVVDLAMKRNALERLEDYLMTAGLSIQQKSGSA